MKTLNLKKIATLSSILILMLVSSPMFSQGAPDNPNNPGVDSNNVNDQVPIDQDIWLGVLGGCLIGAYFFVKNKKSVMSK